MASGLKVYLAGSLFDLRHLAGNALLREALERQSDGRYAGYLPQDYEHPLMEAKAIRDADLEGLLGCEAAVFQFDGAELDSGTVAEFMAAKFADIPCVLLRTDFRRGGDRNAEPWNLMCSFYPRTEALVVDGMELYGRELARGGGQESAEAARRAMDGVAARLARALDAVVHSEPVAVDRTGSAKEQLRGLLGMGSGGERVKDEG